MPRSPCSWSLRTRDGKLDVRAQSVHARLPDGSRRRLTRPEQLARLEGRHGRLPLEIEGADGVITTTRSQQANWTALPAITELPGELFARAEQARELHMMVHRLRAQAADPFPSSAPLPPRHWAADDWKPEVPLVNGEPLPEKRDWRPPWDRETRQYLPLTPADELARLGAAWHAAQWNLSPYGERQPWMPFMLEGHLPKVDTSAGYKAHITCRSNDDVLAALTRVLPVLHERGMDYKYAGYQIIMAEPEDAQSLKGVVIYFPDRARLEDDAAALLSAMDGWHVPHEIPGDAYLGNGLSLRCDVVVDLGVTLNEHAKKDLYAPADDYVARTPSEETELLEWRERLAEVREIARHPDTDLTLLATWLREPLVSLAPRGANALAAARLAREGVEHSSRDAYLMSYRLGKTPEEDAQQIQAYREALLAPDPDE